MKIAAFIAFNCPAFSHAGAANAHDQCKDVKAFYKDKACCGSPDTHTGHQLLPIKKSGNLFSTYANSCHGKKQNLSNANCFTNSVTALIEQSGADITKGTQGAFDSSVTPQTAPYWKSGLCPVNVHWHLGTEHRSAGEFDETFAAKGPSDSGTTERRGFRCKHYNSGDAKFTTEYKWKYCSHMKVGETYEVHWPHSVLGKCGTSDQYQSPFYDGVFCTFTAMPPAQGLANAVGVQGQVFTVVNDERYYYPDLIRGMIVEGDYGKHITKYTGSTTGTSRNNKMCSRYAPITWQVDRTCHLISASSFDKLCADMLAQKDDMSSDTHPHGSRELVWGNLSADNRHYRRLGDETFLFKIEAMVYE